MNFAFRNSSGWASRPTPHRTTPQNDWSPSTPAASVFRAGPLCLPPLFLAFVQGCGRRVQGHKNPCIGLKNKKTLIARRDQGCCPQNSTNGASYLVGAVGFEPTL